MKIDFESEAARTLTAVREISENWHHRPAPNKLYCIPVIVFCCTPVSALKRRIDDKLEIAMLLAVMSREVVNRKSAIVNPA